MNCARAPSQVKVSGGKLCIYKPLEPVRSHLRRCQQSKVCEWSEGDKSCSRDPFMCKTVIPRVKEIGLGMSNVDLKADNEMLAQLRCLCSLLLVAVG